MIKKTNNFDDYSRNKGSLLSKIRTPLLSLYAVLKKSPPIWNILNSKGITLYKKNSPILDDLQKRIVKNLIENGIATTSLDELFPNKDILSRLLEVSNQKIENTVPNKDKPFLNYAFGRGSIIDFSNPLIKLSIHPRILEIINTYIGYCAKLVYFDMQKSNLVKEQSLAMGSQRWHRDPALHKLCKMFIYLTDVDEKSGPFTYLLKSQKNAKFGKIFPQRQFGRHGFYPRDGAVEKLVSKNDIMVCNGIKGSIIFCDTIGLHKGGFSISKHRIMCTSTYMSEGEFIKRRYSHPIDAKEKISKLHPVSQFAVI